MIVFGDSSNSGTAEPKLCHFCGKDITRKKRIKNSRGMYACMRCAEERRKALARRERRKASEPALTDDDLMEILGKVPGAAADVSVCKKCAGELAPDAVLCVSCGQPVHGELLAAAKAPKRRRGLFKRNK